MIFPFCKGQWKRNTNVFWRMQLKETHRLKERGAGQCTGNIKRVLICIVLCYPTGKLRQRWHSWAVITTLWWSCTYGENTTESWEWEMLKEPFRCSVNTSWEKVKSSMMLKPERTHIDFRQGLRPLVVGQVSSISRIRLQFIFVLLILLSFRVRLKEKKMNMNKS